MGASRDELWECSSRSPPDQKNHKSGRKYQKKKFKSIKFFLFIF